MLVLAHAAGRAPEHARDSAESAILETAARPLTASSVFGSAPEAGATATLPGPSDASAVRATLPPVGRFPRPLLLIAGGVSKPMGLEGFVRYFTASGANQFGGVVNMERRADLMARLAALDPAAGQLVFTLQKARRFAPFEHDARELGSALETLSQATGSRVDCVAESKAAIEVRMYLRDGGDKIANLILLAPVVKGLPIVGEVAWLAGHLPFVDRENRETLKGWVSDVKLGPWVWNRQLRSLNEPGNLREEAGKVGYLTVLAGDGHNILAGRLGPGLPLPWLRGDHDVPVSHSRLPSADEVLLFTGEGSAHDELLLNPRVLAAAARILEEGSDSSLAAKRAELR